MRYFTSLGVLCLGVLIVSWPAERTAKGCAWVTKVGDHVEVTDESALIVWDEKAKKQHFVRRAKFDARAPYFGFLVPSPTRPELAEAPDEVFTDLLDWTRPEEMTEQRHFTSAGWLRATSALGNGLEKSADVTILDETRVAGLDAVVLKATDGKALNDWLAKHGFATRPALDSWLNGYTRAGWVITAFRIAKEGRSANDVETKAVRMSFSADQPFFPYSEPPDKSEDRPEASSRSLRIFLIAPTRMEGALDAPRAPWPGHIAWAGPLSGAQREGVTRRLASEAIQVPEGAWLTVFDDYGPRTAGVADVYFSPSSIQSIVRRPPIIHYEEVIYPPWSLLLSCVLLTLNLVVSFHILSIIGRRRPPRAGKS
jgi:hypothetical protein